MTIIKKGNQWCVVSENGGKNLGCFPSESAAKNRLQEVEYFKHKGKSDMVDYGEIFNTMGKDIKPSPSEGPVKITNTNKALKGLGGSLAGTPTMQILDNRDHFPVETEAQAKASVNRVMQLQELPGWWNGSLNDLRVGVYKNAKAKHPEARFNVSTSVERILALSDGQTPADTKKSTIKDPADVTTNKVGKVGRPSLAFNIFTDECQDADTRKALSKHVVDILTERKVELENALNLANRICTSGLTGEEFDELPEYCQQDIVHFLTVNGVKARRIELLGKLSGN